MDANLGLSYLQNLHTHTKFCDGVDTPTELLEQALSQGFDSIGFSDHSYMEYSKDHGMTIEATAQYGKEMKRLKKKFEGQIDIFCGIEYDLYSGCSLREYDFVIGAVHYLKKDGRYIGIDRNAETVSSVINNEFCGNSLEFSKYYYETMKHLTDYKEINVVAHFDLVAKNSEKCPDLIPRSDPDYQKIAIDALHVINEKIKIFEINTGAIARGYRTTPYPDDFILREIKKMGSELIISSDCHNANYLKTGFSLAIALAKRCGFDHILVLRKNGFEEVGLS